MYVVTSKRKKRVIATNNLDEIYNFVTENQDAKFRELDYTGKTKILNRQVFLSEYLKKTNNKERFFAMVEILIPQYKNYHYFIGIMGLREEYKKFKELI